MKTTWIFGAGTAVLAAIVALVAAVAPPLWAYAVGSVLLVSEISLLGVFALSVNPLTLANLTKLLISLAVGAMLGNAFVHLVPESIEYVTDGKISGLRVGELMALGFFISLVIQKGLNFHCHRAGAVHHAEELCLKCDCDEPVSCARKGKVESTSAADGHEAHHGDGACACAHDEEAPAAHDHAAEEHGHYPHQHIHPTGPLGVMAHLVDNLTDGILIGIAFLISIPTGIAMASSVVAHEIPGEFGYFGVLVKAGYSRTTAVAINLGSAFVALGGTVLMLGLGEFVKDLPVYLTPFGFGQVIYVVAAGLVPMMHEEKGLGRSALQIGIMLAGFAAMYGAKILELSLGA